MRVEVVATEALGDRSYIAHDGTAAVVVDPQRDLDRLEQVVADLGVTVAMVVETHVHNDYVTGGLALARATGAQYVVAAVDEVEFDRTPAADGQEFAVGELTVRAMATPGHTDGHLSFVISSGDEPPAVFTGGSLLFGSVGRTDLVDPARTDELTRAQYHSARRLAAALPDETAVYPTHGFGSFCSSGSASGGDSSTIGAERSRNDALVEDDEDRFVAKLVAGLTAYPAYYIHMAPLNRKGPEAPDLSPAPSVSPGDLAKRIADGEWVVDLRHRVAYARDHLNGTISVELGNSFSTYLGWIFPYGSALTLIGESEQQVTDAQRQLVRIGIDRPTGAAVGSPGDLADNGQRRSYPVVGFADVPVASDTDVVLDVRRDDEYVHGSIPRSVHIPLHRLLTSLAEVPDARLWVHCESGFRASIAASLLDRAGRDVVLIDDSYSTAIELGLATR